MSQRTIAKLAGVSQATVSRALNGTHQVRWDNAKRLAKVMAIPVSVLLEGDPAKIQAALEGSPMVNN